jgi:hypothetical protein
VRSCETAKDSHAVGQIFLTSLAPRRSTWQLLTTATGGMEWLETAVWCGMLAHAAQVNNTTARVLCQLSCCYLSGIESSDSCFIRSPCAFIMWCNAKWTVRVSEATSLGDSGA